RLPTEAEQEYILRAGGTAKGKYHFGNDESKLEKYAWFNKNSGDTTHPVGDRLPLIIDGRRFHDVIGNVWEWSWDEWSNKLPEGKNPVHASSSSSGVFRVVRGGSSLFNAQILHSAFRYGATPGSWSDRARTIPWWSAKNSRHWFDYASVGFRLVRTVPNP
ncbi:MAG: SUMF1/EgtB/PvdO family nonheme iron enzyme, partial [Bacteriovoracales bacterium]|nr:SUMF1/EgtB/PvdO family nonheme iron enzyme [Bacteriovoracales bacterium]